jgi:hypothetical protein
MLHLHIYKLSWTAALLWTCVCIDQSPAFTTQHQDDEWSSSEFDQVVRWAQQCSRFVPEQWVWMGAQASRLPEKLTSKLSSIHVSVSDLGAIGGRKRSRDRWIGRARRNELWLEANRWPDQPNCSNGNPETLRILHTRTEDVYSSITPRDAMFVLRPGQSWAGSQVTVIVRAATANRAASVSPKPAIGDDTHGHRLRRLAGWRNRRHGGTLRLSLTKAAWGLPGWSGRTGSSPHPRRVPSSQENDVHFGWEVWTGAGQH